MKKLLILLSCAMLISSVATAQTKKRKKPMIREADEAMSGQGYGTAGCGLGSILFGDQKGMIQIVAATSNGISGNQTFAISTGTSNCQIDTARSAQNAELFIEVNREALAKDISRGNGESISHLASIVGCSDTSLLGAKLQKNFDQVFPTKNVPAEQSRKVIFELIENDTDLAQNCRNVG